MTSTSLVVWPRDPAPDLDLPDDIAPHRLGQVERRGNGQDGCGQDGHLLILGTGENPRGVYDALARLGATDSRPEMSDGLSGGAAVDWIAFHREIG
jgi:hypothetical protein